MQENLTTKDRIFRRCIHLFADYGYESTSMKIIAKNTGIQTASIYNHFPTKEDILAAIYQHFIEHQNDCRLTEEDYIPILKTGSAADILGIFNYPTYDEQDPDPLMFDIIRLLWSRIHIDPAAREVYRVHVVDEAYRFINEVIRKGIELNRIIMKEEDIFTFASLALAAENYVASTIPLYPNVEHCRNMSLKMNTMLAATLKLNPPID